MDARITKARLSNLLSYDWLKILIAIAVAVVGLVLVFTMAATRPGYGQTFVVYGYDDVIPGDDFSTLKEDMERKDVFSYEILEIGSESFYGTSMSNGLLSMRRMVGDGTVMFLTDNTVYKTNEDGSVVTDEETGEPVVEEYSTLYSYAMGLAAQSDTPVDALVYDTRYYRSLCEAYFAEFFGENWEENAVPDEALVRASFLNRNAKDKRFKTDEAREAGILEERDRLIRLREDYLFVREQFERGVLSDTVYATETQDGETVEQALGICLGKLPRLRELVYYTAADGSSTVETVNLVILYNNYKTGNDLRYETVSFLRYLVETYGA